MRVRRELPHPAHHFRQSQPVGVEHRATAIPRKAVAGEVRDVDVRGAQCDAFFQDARALVDQCEDAPADDFVVVDGAGRAPISARYPAISASTTGSGIASRRPAS